jgi:hypothetical protein
VDWSEHCSAHELVGLGEVYPAHFGQLLLVADERLSSLSWAGCQIDHLAPSMRPAEVAALTRNGGCLPAKRWGHLTFAGSSPAPGRAYTDDGQVHEHRGLKGRTRGRPSRDSRARRPTRRVPIPPELVTLLRAHLEQFGAGPDGRLFRSENGNPVQPSTWWQVWQKVRPLALTPEQLATPLLRRPYDLRHSGVTCRLNSGVPPTEVAAWAGHSVEVLMRVYARCMTGLEDVWISRMDGTLPLQDTPRDEYRHEDPSGGEEHRQG